MEAVNGLSTIPALSKLISMLFSSIFLYAVSIFWGVVVYCFSLYLVRGREDRSSSINCAVIYNDSMFLVS